ncbi:MAG TPA: M3 family oligoendopeptidase [Candidatus Dormibacteraeota bacterium]|nr:M3 family oligoendopeptidase [Candidatus Dormibacteraeota bacterium]
MPRWDLSNVFPSLDSDALKTALSDLKSQVDTLDEFLDGHEISRNALKENGRSVAEVTESVDGYLERANSALRLYSTINAYVESCVATDSFSAQAKRLESELELVGVRLQKQQVRFRGWVGVIKGLLPAILTNPGPAREHAFYLRETAEQSRYLMSEPEEALAAELELSGSNAWSKLQGTVCSQLTVEFDLSGKVQKLPISALQNLSHSSDEGLRRRAYEAELAAWESVSEPLAAALNGVKGSAITLYRRRGRKDALHDSLDTSRIDRETLDTLFSVMRESFPIFRRYMMAKAKRFGKDRLAWWDLFAPVGKNERTFTWPEAVRFILARFGAFDERLERLAKRAFENNWIDVGPRNGKRGGAFCMDVPGVEESRVLCNFDGSLDQVSTVAHELGHAFHNECLARKPMLRRKTPMTLAETASIMNETIVTNAALADAAKPEEALAILEMYLGGSNQVIVDISSRFIFEKEVFERRVNSELSADDFCAIMLRCQKETYGNGLSEEFIHKYMWAWKVHYYIPNFSFYNYPYAFGLLFGTGLYAAYKEQGNKFVKDYEALLASTGEATPAELASRFGFDIRRPDFWRSSIRIIEEKVRRYVEL